MLAKTHVIVTLIAAAADLSKLNKLVVNMCDPFSTIFIFQVLNVGRQTVDEQ